MSVRAWCFVSALVACACASASTDARGATAASDPAPAAGSFVYPIQSPVDERIDPNYRGISVAQVISSLERRPPPRKGEFETSDAFGERLSKSRMAPLFGRVKISDLLTFVFPVEPEKRASAQFKYQYDADSQSVSVWMDTRPCDLIRPWKGYEPNLGSLQHNGLVLSKSTRQLGTYEGTTAFGVKANVRKSGIDGFGLAFGYDLSGDLSSVDGPRANATFDLPRDVAQGELRDLRVMLLFSADDQPLGLEHVHLGATIDSPVDLTINYRWLLGTFRGAIYYSGKTGRVLAKSPATLDVNPLPTTQGEQRE